MKIIQVIILALIVNWVPSIIRVKNNIKVVVSVEEDLQKRADKLRVGKCLLYCAIPLL
jgi:hypothetical protein